MDQALEGFRKCGTSYDIAHAQVVLSEILSACGREREAIAAGAIGRAIMTRKGYGLLSTMYPKAAFSPAERIEAALTTYACGDALGLPWENLPLDRVDPERAEQLPAREGWARGATSDDTALTLLVAEYLAEEGPVEAVGFLRLLSERADDIPGLGPSTRGAIERFRATGQLPSNGNTNGAVMRALPVGWAVPMDQASRRRQWTIELSRATHGGREAQAGACVMAACAAWALEGAPPATMLEVAIEEAEAACRATGADRRIEAMLRALAAGEWAPPAAGISLDPYETTVAALRCVRQADSLRAALIAAVQLRGDTDTVAALTAGLLGSQLTTDAVLAQLGWSEHVCLPDRELMATLARRIGTRRALAAAEAEGTGGNGLTDG
jgi:ADP-ribosylglycohydrolase